MDVLQACEFISTLACPPGTVFGVQAAPARNLAPLPTLPLSLPLPWAQKVQDAKFRRQETQFPGCRTYRNHSCIQKHQSGPLQSLTLERLAPQRLLFGIQQCVHDIFSGNCDVLSNIQNLEHLILSRHSSCLANHKFSTLQQASDLTLLTHITAWFERRLSNCLPHVHKLCSTSLWDGWNLFVFTLIIFWDEQWLETSDLSSKAPSKLLLLDVLNLNSIWEMCLPWDTVSRPQVSWLQGPFWM